MMLTYVPQLRPMVVMENFIATKERVGCYCHDQNCFEDKSGIGCLWCVELVTEKGVISQKR